MQTKLSLDFKKVSQTRLAAQNIANNIQTPMNKLNLLAVMLLFAAMPLMNCNAQKHTAGIIIERVDVLYAGIPNPVVIVGSVSHKKLHIDWDGAEARYLGHGRYDVSVPSSSAGRLITIRISAELKKGKMVDLGSTLYRVKPVPPPNVFVGAGIRYGEYEKEQILKNPLVVARMGTEFDLELRWQILSYKVTFICDEDKPITVKGPLFGDIVTEKIQNAPSGTIVVFSDIKVQSIAGEYDIQERIVIRIK